MKRTEFINGIRGYAALSIFLIHVGGPYRILHPYLAWLIEKSKYGVVFFFFLSGFVTCLSLYRNKKIRFFPYIIRRYTRLASIYIPILIVCILIQFLITRQHIPLTDFLLHVTFTNLDFVNHAAQTSVLGTEWSMPIIFFYSLCIPLLFILAKRVRWALLPACCGAIYLYYHQTLVSQFYQLNPEGLERFSLQNYIFTYVFAITMFSLAYNKIKSRLSLILCFIIFYGIFRYISDHSFPVESIAVQIFFIYLGYMLLIKPMLVDRFSGKLSLLFELETLAFLFFYLYIYVWFPIDPYIMLTISTGLFILTHLQHRSYLLRIVFENKAILFISSISFSFYLIHLPVIQLYDTLSKNISIFSIVRLPFIFLVVTALAWSSTKAITCAEKRLFAEANFHTPDS